MTRTRVLIMGAAGRDFHVFNTCFRDDPAVEVVAFTAAQIQGIADRRYPPELAGPHYPEGIPIVAESELETLIGAHDIRQAVFAYSDISHLDLMHTASRALAAGADFRLAGPANTMLRSIRPVVSIGAVRTGVGKSQTSRYVAELLKRLRRRVAVIRHPMPYGDLLSQRCQRFASLEDLELHGCTIEEREEYEPHILAGNTVYAGVDYEQVLRCAEADCDVILWDGGNNDFPFVRPDLHIVLADPLRPGHESSYHPGETNLRLADIVILCKTDVAAAADIAAVEANCRRLAPHALILHAASPLIVDTPQRLFGQRVLVIEDGPSLTHGEMPYGAGIVAARRFGAQIVDAKPFAVGKLLDVYQRYPHLAQALPAMGYNRQQLADLSATIEACPCDLVLSATPIDLSRVIAVNKPLLRVRYELQEVSGPALSVLLEQALQRKADLARP